MKKQRIPLLSLDEREHLLKCLKDESNFYMEEEVVSVIIPKNCYDWLLYKVEKDIDFDEMMDDQRYRLSGDWKPVVDETTKPPKRKK